MKNDKVYLEQMLDSISKIESFLDGIDKEVFLEDQKTQSAAMLQLMLIGEVAKKVSPETKTKIDIPWKEIIGFRDVAVHNYFSMDFDIVWNTAKSDLVLIKDKLSSSK